MGFVTPTTPFLTVWGHMDHSTTMADEPEGAGRCTGMRTNKWTHTHTRMGGEVARFEMHCSVSFHFMLDDQTNVKARLVSRPNPVARIYVDMFNFYVSYVAVMLELHI